MKNNKYLLSLIWALSFLILYLLNVFGFLSSILSGGINYYIGLFCLFLLLFYHYYFLAFKNSNISVRSLIKPTTQAICLFIVILVLLSLLLPETFKEAELKAYESRFVTNGYTGEDISENIRMLDKLYYLFLTVGSFLTHFVISLIAILIFKVLVIVKFKIVADKT